MDAQDALNTIEEPGRSSDANDANGRFKDMSALQKTELLRLLYNGESRKRRKFLRKPYSIPIDYTTKEGPRGDFIKDICGDGLFIETRNPLQVGEDISMGFSLPNSSTVFKCEGRVIRTEASGMAVEFKWRSGFFG